MLMESERKCGETMKTILIIDDDVHIGNVLEEILTREGYHTLRAYSGTEAILVLAHTCLLYTSKSKKSFLRKHTSIQQEQKLKQGKCLHEI